MMMDEEEITWNLKGPKRMKKRRELNALIRNNVKYKSLLARPHSCAHKSDEFSMINCSSSNNANGSAATGGGASGRLLNGLNYSSTDEDEQRDFYYAANKSIIKEKSRSFYCKIFQMILVGCFLTLLILVGIILLFSYSKFHELLSDLKREVDTQNAHNRKSIEDLTKQMDQYDLMLKQLEAKVSGGTNEKSTFKDSQERNPRETSPKRVARSIRSLDALNKVNTHLIRWLFNETFINEGNETTSTTPMTGTTRRQQAKAFMNNNQKRVLNSMMLSKARRNEIYQKVIDEFLKSNYDVAMILSSSSSSANGSNDEYLAVDDIGAEIEAYFEGFEQSIKNDILYEIEKSVIKPLMETLSKCKCSQNTTITQPQAA